MSPQPAILDGTPVRTDSFPARRTMGPEEQEAARKVLESDVLSAFIGGPGDFFYGGEQVQQFEEAWANQFGYQHAISCNSWTSGLVLSIGAAGVGPGDEVICTPYSMSASATCALFYGGIPVFADIDPETFCLDPASIEERITERTKAIVVVHLFGQPADMDAINEIAEAHDIRVIEDAAQAPGATYKGQPVGALGDLGGFSLNFHKHIHTGEGGVIVTDDDELAERCRMIRNHGENSFATSGLQDLANTFGGNYRLTELQAAIGTQQLKRLHGYLDTRRRLADRLRKRLDDISGIYVPECKEERTHSYYVCPLKYNAQDTGLSRELFVRSLLAELPSPDDFESTPITAGYVEPLYMLPLFQNQVAIGSDGFPFNYNEDVDYDYSKGLCPVTERLYQEEMLLSPIVREPLGEDDIDDFAEAIAKVIEHADLIRAEVSDDGEMITPVDAANQSNT